MHAELIISVKDIVHTRPEFRVFPYTDMDVEVDDRVVIHGVEFIAVINRPAPE
jgi:hypothetical protein